MDHWDYDSETFLKPTIIESNAKHAWITNIMAMKLKWNLILWITDIMDHLWITDIMAMKLKWNLR